MLTSNLNMLMMIVLVFDLISDLKTRLIITVLTTK